MSEETKRIRGVVIAIESCVNEHPERLFSADMLQAHLATERELDCTELQVSNAANYLARVGRINRQGISGSFTYRALLSEENPIELLLDAMAKAEPVLRKMAKLWEILNSQDLPAMLKKQAD